ncbi:hypothetical protein [Croceicoccus naphthovorans]|uniref:Uncharacterized protein n=1 Tax=Croceicoccus naphthovorans TaxID=1348774 RepID=A0A0G3XFN9_9SPHN|nr:hypothetical protein [Croceicoccus naphthovorans]AKM09173.1 hypothetical protein AB433_03000 [Croceicoccus naphthovorans]MBB3990460.1 hypothetical protein [Croceicoccus naphthovorans]
MRKIGEEIHVSTDEARGGDTPHVMRYVLMFSLLLAIILLSAVWMFGAWQQAPADGWPVSADEHALGG